MPLTALAVISRVREASNSSGAGSGLSVFAPEMLLLDPVGLALAPSIAPKGAAGGCCDSKTV